MSRHCSQELAADYSPQSYWDGIRLRRAKLRNPGGGSYCSDRETESLTGSRYGTTSALLTADPGEDLSTLSPEDSRARTSVLRVQEKGLPAHVRRYGSNMSESLKKLDLVLSSRKTRQTCELEDLPESSRDLTAWGMTAGGVFWEVGTSARVTKGTECGYLPTITVQDARNNGGPSQMRRNTKPLNAVVGGPVNPYWSEWLIGWPIGWTDLRPLGMDKFQSWRQQHLSCFLRDYSNDKKGKTCAIKQSGQSKPV
ncbi:hypothetical protein Mal48_01810 [Thalassoglobus polymorphus]|uniref:Uncharacterized protein n=1 Tax=Thalassoglobus polymorphus TaxID=2527994 RepID=A0A517QH35_9PLAN|nr:hypothetical protein Mal48_01360 [Thalassoglobus polymorphus]QDT30952.1 hypothetical protein Mal48_01810 [Thalassoglobus polymorphus]